MENEGIESLINLIDRIEITEENKEQINEMKELIEQKDYAKIIEILNQLKNEGKIKLKNMILKPIQHNKDESDEKSIIQELLEEDINDEENDDELEENNEDKAEENIYPKELSNMKLERAYIGLLLETPKAISMYYIIHEDCYFESKEL